MNTESRIREPAVAGQFYEENPEKLRKNVGEMLASAGCPEIPAESSVQALIVPHAGYVFSGQTAAKTFCAVKKGKYARAVIIAPSHTAPFSGLASSVYTGYRTPLGVAQVDAAAVRSLTGSNSRWIKEFTQAHINEHSLEVQLPFLQILFPELPIVPLICGHTDKNIIANLAENLFPLMKEENLWVISSDFTHFGHSFGYMPFSDNVRAKLEKLDLGAVKAIQEVDCRAFSDYVDKTGATICGANPIKILLKTAELASEKGSKFDVRLIEYTTSGALTGDFSHCVSYAGIIFLRSAGQLK